MLSACMHSSEHLTSGPPVCPEKHINVLNRQWTKVKWFCGFRWNRSVAEIHRLLHYKLLMHIICFSIPHVFSRICTCMVTRVLHFGAFIEYVFYIVFFLLRICETCSSHWVSLNAKLNCFMVDSSTPTNNCHPCSVQWPLRVESLFWLPQ